MQTNYNEVPNIISSKDLDYLSDMFNWIYIAYKKTNSFSNQINDNMIKEIFDKASNTFHGNISKILTILSNGGNNE